MIIPDKILVGFQNRIPNQKMENGLLFCEIDGEKAFITNSYPHRKFVDEEKYKEYYQKYAFIVFKEGKKIRKEYSWNQWRQKEIEPLDILNVPTSGFTLKQTYQRSRDWFGSGRSVWVVNHPQGFVFEITSNNLEAIIDNCDIIKGEIIGECIFAWEGMNMSLIPVSSEEYQKSVQDTLVKTLAKNIKINNVDVGNEVLLASNQKAIYLGRFLYSLETVAESFDYYRKYGNYNERFELIKFKNFKYAFEVKDKNNEASIIVLSLPKIAKILSSNKLNEEQVYEKLFNIKEYKITIFNHRGYTKMLFKENEDLEKIISINSKTINNQEYSHLYYYKDFEFKDDNKIYFKHGGSLSYIKDLPFTYNILQLNYKGFSKQIL